MTPARHLLVALGPLLAVCGAIALANYAIDPLWCFDHPGPAREGFDERQQKTNQAYFNGLPENTLVLGSSRTTYLDVPGACNMAVSGMMPEEYEGFARYAEARHGRPFDTVILGLDFFGTSLAPRVHGQFQPPEHYQAVASAPLYRYKLLVSFDTARHALRDWQGGFDDPYERDGRRLQHDASPGRTAHAVEQDLQDYQAIYGAPYRYDEHFAGYLHALKARHPHVLAFTTPESRPLYELAIQAGRARDIARWKREIARELGGFTDFTGVNSVTSNPANYVDAHHFRPQVAAWIVERLLGQPGPPADFGRVDRP